MARRAATTPFPRSASTPRRSGPSSCRMRDARGSDVLSHRILGALPLPACGERVGVRGILQELSLWAAPLTRSLSLATSPRKRGEVGARGAVAASSASRRPPSARPRESGRDTPSHNLLILRAHLLTSRQRRTKPEQDHTGKRTW